MKIESCLNVHRLLALTSTVMMCLWSSCFTNELTHYHNRLTADAVSLAPHSAVDHQDNRDTHVRLLLIDCSSVFNTILPSKLITKTCASGSIPSSSADLNLCRSEAISSPH